MMRPLHVSAALCAFTFSALLLPLDAAKLPSSPDLVDYTYTVSRRGAEKRPGSLSDGDTGTGLLWHTKFRAHTDIVCELRESRDIDRVEIHLPKYTKWYIVRELRLAVDDGFGGFGEPRVLPGIVISPKGAPLRDGSCTNHVISASGLGKTVRVKVTVISDAAAGVGEIRLFGKKISSAVGSAKKDAVPRADMEEVLSRCRRFENRHWRLAFNPVGGRVMSLYSKATGTELTSPDTHGSFAEEAWDRRKSRKFLLNQPYVMNYAFGPCGGIDVTASCNAQGGAIDFLKVTKRYSASDDSTALKVDYRFENVPEAMALQNYALLIHTTLGVYGREVTCYYPTTEGVVAVAPDRRGNEYWGHRPARGWMAAATDEGTGVAVTMPFKDVKAFYSWFSQVPTLEWRMIPIGLEAGAYYDVRTEVIPFKGLKTVSGAGGGLVGALEGGLCKVLSSRAGEVTAEADGKRFKLKFPKPGSTATFRTRAASVAIRRGDAVVCRLDRPPADGPWTLAKEEPQRESSVAEVDLACYTNFPRTVSRGWAKPLPQPRLKVSVITGNGNQLEVGRLAERFDFDYRTIGVGISGKGGKRSFSNPIFSDGDNYSLVNVSDIERGVKKVLEYGSDVILVGGVPFSAFKKELRELLLKRVKEGTALVWIGLDTSVPELGFTLKKARPARAAPVSKTPDFASVPFSLFGGEDVFAIDPAEDAVVHAECSGRPYLVEGRLGKGRVFHIAYRALTHPPWQSPGLTPADLKDFYETKDAPVEQYYSLIAKTLLAAAGKKLPLKFVKSEIAPSCARFTITSAGSGVTCWDWRVTDPFGREIARGSRDVKLKTGSQKVSLDALGVPPAQGPLLFELSVRTRHGGVVNWGAWTFSNVPEAQIVSLKPERRWLREGEDVGFSLGVSGNVAGKRIAVSLVDSYGRTLAEAAPVPSASVTGKFRIENALPARSYTIDARLFSRDGAQLSRRRAELRVRPKAERYVWDDFEVGTWASANNREYLWGGLAEIYHRIGISTVIANPPRMQKDFPMRYNINPTLLSGAGLHRSSEPDAYAKTGDKMKLVRPTCLSSPAFFSGREKSVGKLTDEISRYGLRFVWFGDELSITGYGGTPVDFCFSEHCLREMRAFAKGRYGTLAKLNEAWETDFPDWDSVVPFTRQEVWAADGRHVAGWSDHLEFMDSRLTNSIAFSVNRLKSVDPAVMFAVSGTQRPSAYGGMDWWKQLNILDAALNYGGGGQFDIHRSFRPDGGLMPWNWGYSRRGAGAVDSVWLTAFYGMRGIMGFQSVSQINQDWTFSKGLRDTFPHIRRLVEGTGKHFVNNLVTKKEVAVLYSQASLRAAFIERRREEHDRLESKVRLLLRNLGYSYDYVSGDELAAGALADRGYRALVLCDALAMSDAEIASVKAFAASGGTVIAEGVPATREANCRRRAASPLRGLFGRGSRHVLFPEIDTRYLKAVEYPAKAENASVVKMERDRYESALVRAGASAARLLIIDENASSEVVNVEIFPKSDRSGNPMWGVLASGIERPRDVRFQFPRKAWTYDLVSGRVYGEVKELRLPLGRGTPYAFVQLPEKAALMPLETEGASVRIACVPAVDAVVRLEVFRPDGSEVKAYAENVLLRSGKGVHEIPFALSDPSGVWKIRTVSIFGKMFSEAKIDRLR